MSAGVAVKVFMSSKALGLDRVKPKQTHKIAEEERTGQGGEDGEDGHGENGGTATTAEAGKSYERLEIG